MSNPGCSISCATCSVTSLFGCWSSITISTKTSRRNTRRTCVVRGAGLIRGGDDKPIQIVGHGVGPIDAFFRGLLDFLHAEYPSLNSIVIDKFAVIGKLGGRGGVAPGGSQSDALASVTVGIRNSAGRSFEFVSESRSVTRSGIEATLRATEYFVNSERAFKRAYRALRDARERNRQDLIIRYTDLMSQLVKNTSYSDVIEQIRADLGGA